MPAELHSSVNLFGTMAAELHNLVNVFSTMGAELHRSVAKEEPRVTSHCKEMSQLSYKKTRSKVPENTWRDGQFAVISRLRNQIKMRSLVPRERNEFLHFKVHSAFSFLKNKSCLIEISGNCFSENGKNCFYNPKNKLPTTGSFHKIRKHSDLSKI